MSLSFESRGCLLYFSWKFKYKGFQALEGGDGPVEVLLIWKLSTGNLDEDFPGTRSCGDRRFCFLMTLEIGSEPEADSKIIVVSQQIIWVLQSL